MRTISIALLAFIVAGCDGSTAADLPPLAGTWVASITHPNSTTPIRFEVAMGPETNGRVTGSGVMGPAGPLCYTGTPSTCTGPLTFTPQIESVNATYQRGTGAGVSGTMVIVGCAYTDPLACNGSFTAAISGTAMNGSFSGIWFASAVPFTAYRCPDTGLPVCTVAARP